MRAAAFEFGAVRAIAGLTAAAFDICFDRAISFNAKSGFDADRFPVVLLANAVSRDRTVDLWEELGQSLKRSIGKRAGQIEPHMTVAYDPRQISEQAIPPIRWRVHEVVLVRSFVGLTRHVVIHRHPLRRPN
jgi:2'-5' RNA ligase